MTVAFASTTEMVMLADTLLPSLDVAVMVALPMATPVTTPWLLTVATAVLLLAQVRLLSVAFVGATVAVSCNCCPISTLFVVALTLTAVTGTVVSSVWGLTRASMPLTQAAISSVLRVSPSFILLTRLLSVDCSAAENDDSMIFSFSNCWIPSISRS